MMDRQQQPRTTPGSERGTTGGMGGGAESR